MEKLKNYLRISNKRRWKINYLLKKIDNWKKPNGFSSVISILLISALLGLTWTIVYYTGGTKYVYLHLMYVPVVISAFIFRVPGGIITAIIAGILLGPLMPLDVENNIRQSVFAYIYRTAFFVLIGGLVGYLSMWLNLRMLRLQKTLDEMSIVHANTLKNYAKMVSIRDEQTAFHCERVAYNALLIGKVIGLDKQKSEGLYWSGLLHDVGKIGIKEKILLKPDKLTDEEFEEIKRHTVIGYELVTSVSHELHLIALGVRSHHEKWDGNGYPDGLKAKEIPLYGRIIAIVDVFEALTSERPYKASWDSKEALNFIVNHKGAYFDPELVGIFEKLYYEGDIWISYLPIKLDEPIFPPQYDKGLFKIR